MNIRILLIFGFSFLYFSLFSQKRASLPFLQNADSLHQKRLWISASTGFGIYTGTSVGLWQAWYKNNELSRFQFFNDMGEWNQYDKAGHLMAAYAETYYAYEGARWTGMKKKPALWTAFGVGFGIQATIEVMDGFSKKWGFSVGDVGFNTLGSAIFVGQELAWNEQRILFKTSSNPFDYPDDIDIQNRANQLFGTGTFEKFFKDYNAQYVWASANIWSFLKNRENSKFPKWLNVSLGYGVGNIYGGFQNTWVDENDMVFNVDNEFPRYRQILLSFDIDTSKIKTKNRFVNTLFKAINWIKIPSPAFEYNTLGEVKFHPIYW